jgi:hypothetical protein
MTFHEGIFPQSPSTYWVEEMKIMDDVLDFLEAVEALYSSPRI